MTRFDSKRPLRTAARAAALHGTAAAFAFGVLLVLFSKEANASSPGANAVSQLRLEHTGTSALIQLKATTRPVFSVYRTRQPERLTVDLRNCRSLALPPLFESTRGPVRAIAVTTFQSAATPTVRLTITLREDVEYSVRFSDGLLLIQLDPRSGADASKHGPPAKASARARRGVKTEKLSRELARVKQELAEQRAISDAAVVAASQARDAAVKARARLQVAEVRDVRFVDTPTAAEVRIDLSDKPAWRLVSGSPRRQTLVLKSVHLPKMLTRELDASAYGGPIASVATAASPGGSQEATVSVVLRDSGIRGVPRQEGNSIVWSFAKPARETTRAPGQAGADPERSNLLPAQLFERPRVAAARAGGRQKSRAQTYTGRRIDLDFKDADIHNILRLLSDVGRVNIVTSDKVAGRVTIRMKDVPWDQALDVVLRAQGMGMVREGNLIRVAPAVDLQKEREVEIARMKQLTMLQPLETRLIPLSYAQAESVLTQLKYMMSPRGRLTHDARTNMVIARDLTENLDLMEKLIRNLDTQTPQVLIEARIVEARTNFSREIGVQWGGSFTASSAGGNSTGLVFPNQVGIGGGTTDNTTPTGGILLGQATNPNFAVNLPAATGTGAGGALGLTLGSVSGNANVNLRLSAAESSGDIRIVSAPRITTLDNVEAKIEQGVTIPFSQVSAAGVQTTFKDAKLNLTVRPHVTADGSVIMKLSVTNNEPDFVNTGPRGEPTILKKEAATELMVKDGDTTVIGGIYTIRTGTNFTKVPWFAEIPVLGYFFRSRRDTNDRQEVLVFITPRIINRGASIGR